MTICVNQIHPFESLVKLNHVPQVLVVKIPWFTSTLQQKFHVGTTPGPTQTNRHHQDSDISSRGVPTNLYLPLESWGPGWLPSKFHMSNHGEKTALFNGKNPFTTMLPPQETCGFTMASSGIQWPGCVKFLGQVMSGRPFWQFVWKHIWVFPKIWGTPKWMVKIMENPFNMDDLGVPLFLETPI